MRVSVFPYSHQYLVYLCSIFKNTNSDVNIYLYLIQRIGLGITHDNVDPLGS